MRNCSTYNKFFLCLLMMVLCAVGRLHAQDCNGTPTAGSVAASTTQTCPGGAVTLSLSGQSSATGITTQWQSSPDGQNWTNISSGTGTTYTYTVPDSFTSLYFRVAVTCSNSQQSAYTAPVQITLPIIASYVQLPFTEGFEGNWIQICAAGQLPQPMGGLAWNNLPATGSNSWRRNDDGIDGNWPEPDYGAYSPSGSQGSQYSARFHSTYATAPGTLDLYLNCNTTLATKQLSFDYNNIDGTDSLQVLLSSDGGSTFKRLYGAYTTSGWQTMQVIFSSASPTTIIRFVAIEDNGNTDIGLDNINVQEVMVCSGTPPAAKTATNNNTICHGSQFILSAGGLPNVQGFAYQWESSATGSSGWSPIAGATDSTFTSTETANTYYRAVVTCTLSGDSSISNTVALNVPSPLTGNYTINSAVATGGTNFTSFTDAANALYCAGVAGPVVFNVQPGSGPYNEQLLLDSITGTSAANTITFNGKGNTIKFSAANPGTGVVTIQGSSYITLDSLVIDALPAITDTATHYGFGIVMQNQANYNTVQGCRIITDSLTANDNQPASYAGIVLDGTDSYTTINGNSISGGYAGIQAMSGASGNQIVNNTIQQFRDMGIAVQYAGNSEDSLLIQNNIISSSYRPNGSGPGGINVFGASNLVISKNRIFGLQSPASIAVIGVFAINEMQGSVSSVTNNLIYNVNGQQGTAGIVSSNYNSMLVAFNTISVVDSTAQPGSTIDGIFIGGGNTSGTVVENNLVSISAQSNSSTHCINLSTSIQQGFILDYNDYVLNGTSNNAIGYLASSNTTSTTLAGWQQATGMEAHSLTINPVFEDPALGDYKPTSMDLDNRGIPVAGITTDILNVTRNTITPDIGAYEFKACVPIRGTYTIDAGAAPGTARTFLNFTDAYEALRCGIDSAVVFNVKPGSGPYNEQLNMEYITGTSSLNTVTFNGNGATIHFNSTNVAHKAVVEFNGTQHVALDSLVIDATPPAGQSQTYWGIGVQMFNNAGYNTIHACDIITDTVLADDPGGASFEYAYTGIAMIGNSQTDSVSVNHTMFDHNTITGGYCGIGLDGTYYSDSFVNNTIRRFFEYGMSLHNYNSIGGSNSDSVLVQDNDVYSITQGLTGIEVLEANNVTIEKNRVHDIKWFGGSGIIVDDLNSLPGSKVHVVNNLVYNLGYDSTAATPTNYAYGIINYCEGAVFIEHNTVAIHNTAKTGSTTINGIMSLVLNRSGEGGVSTIKNNLVNIDGDGQSKAACIFFATETDPNQTYNFNYNNYYTGGNANNAVGLLNGSAYIQSLADWTAQTGLDSNSVNIDPMFTNAAFANYKPTNYHFDNLGTPLGVLTDLYDTVRSTTHPDIGCIEFNACPPKFAWFTESKQLACIEDPVSFAATDTTINYHVVDEWAWEFGNGNSSSLQNPVVTFTSAGTYNVQLTASTPEGCEVDTAQTITVVDCFKQLFIPNAFTPNGDGLNDVLRVYGNGIQQIRFMVFNQWGEKLFETTSLAEGWDGTQNGKPQPTGVYMYVCQITMDDGRQTVKKGAVNLIR